MQFLEENRPRLIRLDPEVTRQAITRSANLKANVVSEDEREMGKRTILNYGHTIGHALEAATGYERFLHGEAVAIGMMGAAHLSQRLGLIPPEEVERQRRLLNGFGLPTTATGVEVQEVLQAMELDKKVQGGEVRWVLLEGIGKTAIQPQVPEQDVLAILGMLLSPSAS